MSIYLPTCYEPIDRAAIMSRHDWPDDLHIADVVSKHIEPYLPD